jgi:hypothetical protein
VGKKGTDSRSTTEWKRSFEKDLKRRS